MSDFPYIKLLDDNLNPKGIIADYTSLIWNKKYNGVGDCEIYAKVDQERFLMVKNSKFIMRVDDLMLCIIKKVEVTTDVESGDFITITGQDCSCFLDQRIVWNLTTYNDKVENIIRNMVDASLINLNAASDVRRIYTDYYGQFLFLGDKANFAERTTTQISYKNVGEKIRELCNQFHWGYKVELGYVAETNHDINLLFKLYRGADLTDKVIFSENNNNLLSSKHIDDKTNFFNASRVGGEGEGVNRALVYTGTAESFERNELFVDAASVSNKIKYSELIELYPGGRIQTTELDCYVLDSLKIPIIDDNQLDMWDYLYAGNVIIENGQKYFSISNTTIVAYLETPNPSDDDEVELLPAFYNNLLYQTGVESLNNYTETFSLEAKINPYGIFKYKESWNLGDIIKIETKFGMSTNARIAEVLESFSSDGYSVEPKLEYMTEG